MNIIKLAVILHPLNLNSFFDCFNVFYKPFSYFLRPILRILPPQYIKEFSANIRPHKFMTTKVAIDNKNELLIMGIMCPLFPEQMILMKSVAEKKIRQSILLARKSGAKIVTLAGFTSIMTNEINNFSEEIGISVTSGNTLTALLCIEGVERALGLVHRNLRDCTVTIVGATGDIGSICAKFFGGKVKSLVLSSRSIKDSDPIVKELSVENKTKMRIERLASKAIKDADIVIIATSSLGNLFTQGDFKKGSIVCDVSMPPNISKDISSERLDIFIFDGGRAQLGFYKKITSKKWKKLFPNNSIYGCLAESIVLALEGRFENYSVGRGHITESKMQEIKNLAQKHGVYLSEFYRYGKKYTEKEVEDLREIQ